MEKKILLCLYYTMHILSSIIFTCAEAPSADAECTNSLLSLINCEPFLAGTVASPTDTCCVGLGALVKSAPLCLCGVLTDNPAFSSVNLTRALLLPGECDIPIDEGQCAALSAPPPKMSSSPDTPDAPPMDDETAGSSAPPHWSLSLAPFFAAGAAAGTTYFL